MSIVPIHLASSELPEDARPDDADAESGGEPVSADDVPQQTDAAQTLTELVAEAEAVAEPGALDAVEGHTLGKHVKKVFGCWIVVFGWVGAQMGWVLRPFIGDPEAEFQWFRQRESNFFEAVAGAIESLFS